MNTFQESMAPTKHLVYLIATSNMSSPRKQKDPYDKGTQACLLKSHWQNKGLRRPQKPMKWNITSIWQTKQHQEGKKIFLLIAYLNGAVHNWRSLGWSLLYAIGSESDWNAINVLMMSTSTAGFMPGRSLAAMDDMCDNALFTTHKIRNSTSTKWSKSFLQTKRK